MSWFRRKPDPPKTEAEAIQMSLDEKGVPDWIAAMFLDEYLHTRHKQVQEPAIREVPDFNQPVERFEIGPLLASSYIVRKVGE